MMSATPVYVLHRDLEMLAIREAFLPSCDMPGGQLFKDAILIFEAFGCGCLQDERIAIVRMFRI